MNNVIFAVVSAVISIFSLFIMFVLIMIVRLKKGSAKAAKQLAVLNIRKLADIGHVDSLTIIPLVDYYAIDDSYRTEAGVAYIVEAGNRRILFDLGLNKKKEHPSPLLINLKQTGLSPGDLDAVFISHIHNDHVGGKYEERKCRFSLSAGKVELAGIPVYSPGNIAPSENNPGPYVKVINDPEIIDKGIASIGIYPRSLFLIGYIVEQSLAINVKGKGIVLIIGCGHQGIDNIINRVTDIFDEPIYGIIGGLHLPVKGGRVMIGPLNMQNIVGVDRRPLRGMRESDVNQALNSIKRINPQIVSLSPHDSSDWTIKKFKESFGNKYIELQAGKAIHV